MVASFLFACSSAPSTDPSSNAAGAVKAGESYFYDSLLNGHQVIVSLRSEKLIPLKENFFSVVIDGKMRKDVYVTTQKQQALMRKSDTANALIIYPSRTTDIVPLQIEILNEEGAKELLGSINLPVDL